MHQGFALLSEGPVAVSQGGKKYSGKRGYFIRDVFARAPQNLKSQFARLSRWFALIEYRFTYPRDMPRSERQIEAFIREWSWRGKA